MNKVLLCILDGVGIRDEVKGNAFKNASKPFIDKIFEYYPNSLLEASGEYVGLPKGQMGNSEVGHTNIGAGRIVYQPLGLINKKIEDKSFFENKELLEIINYTKENNSNLHIMGLLSDGGIHSHINHLLALIELCKNNNIKNVYYHIFTDGRDTRTDSAIKYIEILENKIKELNIGKIATISGRYYAMDRDNNYDRIYKTYEVLTSNKEVLNKEIKEYWKECQENNITDEFIIPKRLIKEGIIEEKDAIIFFNYRPDRIRELGSALTNKNFKGFKQIEGLTVPLVTMMPASDEIIYKNAFKLEDTKNTLGEYINKLGYTQLRIAETEKYAHVTYFFDGKEEEQKNTKRILIPSPKVKTYDLMPEMSAYKITDELIKEINNNKPDLIILNYANGDMVGHTGNYEKAKEAVEALDKCLEKIFNNINLNEYKIIITADHGNCETMINEDNTINTNHTTNKVPFIITDKNISLKDGALCDIAPTILKIMNIDIPKEMTGKALIKE